MTYVDLSYPLERGMATLPFPQHPLTEFTQTGRIRMEGSNAHKVSFGTHTGTHIDAPYHMIDGSTYTVEQIPLDRLFCHAHLVKLQKNDDEPITLAEISKAPVKPGDALLISTGWSRYYGSKAFYFHYPILEDEAVDYLIDKKIGILGLDTPSPDSMSLPPDSPKKNYIHKRVLGSGIFIVETLSGLEAMEVSEFEFVCLPLKAVGLDGFPVRAVAVC